MPDLLTHTLASYFFVRHDNFRRFRIIFYLGGIFPDLISRPFYILMPKLYYYTISIHSPVFVMIAELMLVEFFSEDIKSAVRNYLFAGTALHFLLDLLQKHLQDGYYWLFPFSWKSFEIPLLWPEDFIRLIPIWLILMIMTEFVIKIYHVSKK